MDYSLAKRRVHLLDELRGLAVLLMVFYHAVYDVVVIFDINIPILGTFWMEWLRIYIACSFMVISGIACRYSRNNLKRGLQCFAVAMVLTICTRLFLPSQVILFGILHMLGLSMILVGLLEPILYKIHPIVGILLSQVLYFFTSQIRYGYLGFGELFRITLPKSLYELSYLYPLGIHPPMFYSADYYPIIPWFFIVLSGVFFGFYFKEGFAPEVCYKPHAPLLSKVGKKAFIIYVLHQPILFPLITIIHMLLK